MANSIVFVVMLAHQCAFTPRTFAGQSIVQTVRVLISYCAVCKPAAGIFSQFFDICRLTAGFEGRMLFLFANHIVP